MATAYSTNETRRIVRRHPFGAHGVLLALPLSLAAWLIILKPFL